MARLGRSQPFRPILPKLLVSAGVASGSMAVTLAPSTFAASGSLTVSASMGATLAPAVFAASGSLTTSASMGATLGAATFAAVGTATGGAVSASMAATLGAATFAASAAFATSATMGVTLAPSVFAASASLTTSASMAATLGAATFAAFGGLATTASMAATLGAATFAAAGTSTAAASASMTATLASAIFNAAGTSVGGVALTFRETLVAKLKSTPALAAIVGDRVFPGAIPTTRNLNRVGPALTYTVSVINNRVLSGPTGSAMATVRLMAWAEDESDADAIAQAIRGSFDAPLVNPWVSGGVEILSIAHEEEDDFPEPPRAGSDRWVHLIPSRYRIRHRISIPS